MSQSILAQKRAQFHKSLLDGLLTRQDGIPSNADKDSKLSVDLATAIADQLGDCSECEKLPGQTSGANFENICELFLKDVLPHLSHMSGFDFEVRKGGKITDFLQYKHLHQLRQLSLDNADLATALGSDYLIKPDVVVTKRPLSKSDINAREDLVGPDVEIRSDLLRGRTNEELLQASVSCKWTLRSDRAQNARSEALNLVRNRKGRLPNVLAVTGEPTISRLKSLALGTGDLDCVYHFALPELIQALKDLRKQKELSDLLAMVEGRRVRDIIDMPLDIVS